MVTFRKHDTMTKVETKCPDNGWDTYQVRIQNLIHPSEETQR